MTVIAHPVENHAGFGVRAACLVGFGMLLVAIDVVGVLFGDLERPDIEALTVLGIAVYGLVLGSVIVWKAAGNAIGWLFGAIGISIAASGLMGILTDRGVTAVSGLSGALWLSWVPLLALVFLWFPTGEPLTRRWRWASWTVYMVLALLVFSSLFSQRICLEGVEEPGSGCAEWVDNPIGIEGLSDAEYGWLSGPLFTSMAIMMLIALGSSVVRYRRAAIVEKLQLKPFLLVTASFVLAFVAESIAEGASDAIPAWIDAWLSLSLIAIPLAATLSVLRYRLYDIDRIISRTVTYAVVVGVLAGVVALMAALVGTRFDSPLVVAATTLGVAAAFNPLRRRVRRWVDRRFNRSRYDAERVMDEFARSLRDGVDEESLLGGWQGVVVDTMHPSSAGVWVRS